METMSEVPAAAAAAAHTTIGSRLGELTVVTRDWVVTGVFFPHHWHLPDQASFSIFASPTR